MLQQENISISLTMKARATVYKKTLKQKLMKKVAVRVSINLFEDLDATDEETDEDGCFKVTLLDLDLDLEPFLSSLDFGGSPVEFLFLSQIFDFNDL